MKPLVPLRPLVLAILLLTPAALSAQTLRATQPELAERSASLAGGQLVALADELVPKLLAAPFDKPIWVTDWPLAPDVFQEVVLTRREVYAPDAHIYKIGPEGKVEVPRSRLALFGGGSTDGKSGLWLSIDPETGELDGNAHVLGQAYALRKTTDGRYALAKAEAFAPAGHQPLPYACGTSSTELTGLLAPPASPLFPTKALAALHTATVAVDTDNELMLLKFGDNQTSAMNYIAQLITGINVMYERDLNVRFLQGNTMLRVSSTADPYTQLPDPTTGNVTPAQLNELTTYWSTNNGGISRALVMLLSGKQPLPAFGEAASGRAWLNGLCSASAGYSFNQVFRSLNLVSLDAQLVGHEIGHIFGSPHTHCYTPPIDNCFSGESGCFSGTETCPAATTINGVTGVQGTVMSYCSSSHTLGFSCAAFPVFHQRTLDLINPIVANKVGICIFPAGGGAGATAAKFYTVPPCRLIDTRNANGALGGPALAASGTRSFTVAGTCGIPADAKAISGNLTVVSPAAAGFLNAYATGIPTTVSLINFRVGQIKANNVVLKLPASGGSLTFQNGSGGLANFLLDVNGYFK